MEVQVSQEMKTKSMQLFKIWLVTLRQACSSQNLSKSTKTTTNAETVMLSSYTPCWFDPISFSDSVGLCASGWWWWWAETGDGLDEDLYLLWRRTLSVNFCIFLKTPRSKVLLDALIYFVQTRFVYIFILCEHMAHHDGWWVHGWLGLGPWLISFSYIARFTWYKVRENFSTEVFALIALLSLEGLYQGWSYSL